MGSISFGKQNVIPISCNESISRKDSRIYCVKPSILDCSKHYTTEISFTVHLNLKLTSNANRTHRRSECRKPIKFNDAAKDCHKISGYCSSMLNLAATLTCLFYACHLDVLI